MSKISTVSLGLARAGSSGEQVRSLQIGERQFLPDFIEL
jgi:hypothetical protein